LISENARIRFTATLEGLEAFTVPPVVDADVHISDPSADHVLEIPKYVSHPEDYFQGKGVSAEQVVADMAVAGIDMCLVWQNPASTAYVGDPAADFQTLRRANEYVAQAAATYPTKFLPAGWTDPLSLGTEKAKEMACYCIHELGMAVVKLNPAQNHFMVDSPDVVAVIDAIVQNGALPALHFGADTPFTPAEGLLAIARHIAPHPIIAVHMGGGGAGFMEAERLYHEARRIGLEQRNIVFVESAKRETHIETDLIVYAGDSDGASSRLCFGSDSPYGLQSAQLSAMKGLFTRLEDPENHPDARVRDGSVTFGPAIRDGFLGGNIARLYADTCRKIVAMQQKQGAEI